MSETTRSSSESFLALYLSQAVKPGPADEILGRYELCEDMAQMLLDTITPRNGVGVETQDIVARIEQGLQGGEAGLARPKRNGSHCDSRS